ncbi:calcium-binding protein, partial [Parachitinimonas caeni]
MSDQIDAGLYLMKAAGALFDLIGKFPVIGQVAATASLANYLKHAEEDIQKYGSVTRANTLGMAGELIAIGAAVAGAVAITEVAAVPVAIVCAIGGTIVGAWGFYESRAQEEKVRELLQWSQSLLNNSKSQEMLKWAAGEDADDFKKLTENDIFAAIPVQFLHALSPQLKLSEIFSLIEDISGKYDIRNPEPPVRAYSRILNIFQSIWGDKKQPIPDSLDGYTALIKSTWNLINGKGPFRLEVLRDNINSELFIAGDESTQLTRRFALLQFNPLTVIGADYSKWSKSLELHNPETNDAGLTAEWLKDRSAMLAGVLKNERDFNSMPVSDKYTYTDLQTGKKVLASGVENPLVIFGFDDEHGDKFGGSANGDHLYGMAGNDTIDGFGGDDYLEGGSGEDSLLGGEGIDTLLGMSGNDTLFGMADNDTLDGGADEDSLDGGAGADSLTGGLARDTLRGGSGDDQLYGEEGNDALYGGADKDQLNGGAGNDWLEGGDGFDTYFVEKDQGNDVLLDSDGVGGIVFCGTALTGGQSKNGGSVFTDVNDSQITYTLTSPSNGSSDLIIKHAGTGQTLTVQKFTNGQLSIDLKGGGTPTAPVGGTPGNDYLYNATTIAGGDGNDFIVASKGTGDLN